jgi:hypothetical protein
MASHIERWPLDRLIPYARNARTHSDAQVAQIAASIKEFGFVNPILAGPDSVIIAGHGRLLAARKLEMTAVPVVIVEGRLINHHFLACWKEIDPAGSKNRGLLSLMRRRRHNLRPEQYSRLAQYLRDNPAIEVIYRFKQRLCYLLLEKHLNQKKCAKLIPRLLRAIAELKSAVLPSLLQLGHTLHAWREEIATMWRFTRNNGITEGFHTKMEVLQRQAYRLRNFQNYRLRVRVMCS